MRNGGLLHTYFGYRPGLTLLILSDRQVYLFGNPSIFCGRSKISYVLFLFSTFGYKTNLHLQKSTQLSINRRHDEVSGPFSSARDGSLGPRK